MNTNKSFIKKVFRNVFVTWALLISLLLGACTFPGFNLDYSVERGSSPSFSNQTYTILNNNIPEFTDDEKTSTKAFENYSKLDSLGRCGVAYANICKKLMPTEKRGRIGQVKPSGWHLIKYDIVDGNYLYNRCHLIAYMLAGENANKKNLITGTRYFNVNGMLPFEDMVNDYVKDTGNHVLYRVTPMFEGDDLVAKGVQMEAYSVEDSGRGVCFNVFVHNIQPGVYIDYATGDSHLDDSIKVSDYDPYSVKGKKNDTSNSNSTEKIKYIVNKNTMKFHLPTCPSVDEMNPDNKMTIKATRDKMIKDGYEPCKNCKP